MGAVGLAAFLSGAGPQLPVLAWPSTDAAAPDGPLLLGNVAYPHVSQSVHRRARLSTGRSGGASALVLNLYTISYPDIYGQSSPFYGPGMSVNGHLMFGYPYPPLTLLMAIPGQILGGDYRYSQLFAMTATGALMAYARPGRIAQTAAALYLFNPRIFFVLEQGWTEPLIIFALAVAAFCVCRGFHRAVPYLFGLFFASKQYIVFTAPAVFLLFPRNFSWRRDVLPFAIKVAATGLLITVPFILWNPEAFIRSVVTCRSTSRFGKRRSTICRGRFRRTRTCRRPGSRRSPDRGTWRAVGALEVASDRGSVLRGDWVAAAAFFAFSKQAFCNHYFFAIGALCIALAVVRGPTTASASIPSA